jgi:flagellar hook-associated protein 1 FlgK
MTMTFVDLVNEVHRDGYGINGKTGLDFFTEHHFTTGVNGNYDRDGDGAADSSWIYRINGTNALAPRDQIGLGGMLTLSGKDDAAVQVPYFAEDTVAELVDRVNNSGAEVTARLNREGLLSFRGTTSSSPDNPDFVIRRIEDSGIFLSGYAGVTPFNADGGGASAYNWEAADAVTALADGSAWSTAPVAHPSGWVEVNKALVSEPTSVASGLGENARAANPGNGEAALAIASLRNTRVMVGQLGTFDDYFADATGRVAMLGEQSGRALETQNQIMKSLHDMRQSISGVNVDEELSNMIKFQHGYAAAARFMTTLNSMFDTLINRMG